MTRPTTSSSIAALVVTVPSRVAIKFVVDRIVKVVPRLVALRAAPAVKACKEFADANSLRIKDKPIGTPIPVTATQREITRFAFIDLIDVDSPPSYMSRIFSVYIARYAYLHIPT